MLLTGSTLLGSALLLAVPASVQPTGQEIPPLQRPTTRPPVRAGATASGSPPAPAVQRSRGSTPPTAVIPPPPRAVTPPHPDPPALREPEPVAAIPPPVSPSGIQPDRVSDDYLWQAEQNNLDAVQRWKANRSSSRFRYAALAMTSAYLPGPPIGYAGLATMFGWALVPKFRGGEVLRRRSFGYCGHLAFSFPPGSGIPEDKHERNAKVTEKPWRANIVHRHALCMAGSGAQENSNFFQFGAGLVFDDCCGGLGLGATLLAQVGWRRQLGQGPHALLIGVPVILEFAHESRASLGLLVGIGNP